MGFAKTKKPLFLLPSEGWEKVAEGRMRASNKKTKTLFGVFHIALTQLLAEKEWPATTLSHAKHGRGERVMLFALSSGATAPEDSQKTRQVFFSRWLHALLLLGLCGLTLAAPVQAAKAKKNPPPAAEDLDLEMIPGDILDAETPESAVGEDKAALKKWETTGSLTTEFQRQYPDHRVPVPLPPGFDKHQIRQGRTSFSWRGTGRLGAKTTLTVQNRVNWIFSQSDGPNSFQTSGDLRELFLTFRLNKKHYLDIGRVNLKEGVASGFNPTDHFKAGAVSLRTSEDPSRLREDRLGALMVRWQTIGPKGSLSVAYAPQVRGAADAWFNGGGDFALALNATNGLTRWHVKFAPVWFEDDNPEFIYYNESGNERVGLNWAKGVGNKHVVYAELSARRGGGALVAMGAAAPAGLGGDPAKVRQQLALGFSYADNRKRNLWVEYHRNQAGFSGSDWRKWFDMGAIGGALVQDPATKTLGGQILGQLWKTRVVNQSLSEPMGREVLFARYSATDAYRPKQDLSAIVFLNLHDGSLFFQPRLDFRLSDSRSAGASWTFLGGKERSEYGSVPLRDAAQVEYTLHF